MPAITCPYCQIVNATKYLHKQHVRSVHRDFFEKNILTSITGNAVELEVQNGSNSIQQHNMQTLSCEDTTDGQVLLCFRSESKNLRVGISRQELLRFVSDLLVSETF